MTVRNIDTIIQGQATSDGDGVQLKRVIGTAQLNYLDPFLLLDEFGSDKPLDYIGGFPAHPHRGFETVTYMLAGRMKHQDNAGHSGVIETGDVQWMTAARGIIHSEMPEQKQGLLAGLQLWVNLPAKNKMDPPRYQEHVSETIPLDQVNDEIEIKVISGTTDNGVQGVIDTPYIKPNYWHVTMNSAARLQQSTNAAHNAFVYVLNGSIRIGDKEQVLNKGELAVLSNADQLLVESDSAADFVYVDGQPLNEPVARGGPFVMNTKQEILDAFHDYQSGQF